MTDEKERMLHKLRAAYEEIEPQERSGKLEEEDLLTQATVRLLQRAWSNLPVPAARPPLRLRSRLFRILTAAPAQAAAALLFVGVTVLTYQLSTSAEDSPHSQDQTSIATGIAGLTGPPAKGPAPARSGRLRNANLGQRSLLHRGPVRLRIRLQLTGLQLAAAPFLTGLTPGPSPIQAGQATPNRTRPQTLLHAALVSNRKGDWSQAIEFAVQVLRLPGATREQRCQALYHLTHAHQALGQRDLSSQSFCQLKDELIF